jgi:hypothetical protein
MRRGVAVGVADYRTTGKRNRLKRISVKVGDQVEVIMRPGCMWGKDGGTRTMKNGDIGTVVRVDEPARMYGVLVDDEGDEADSDSDGMALVMWPDWGEGLIHARDEGTGWRKITKMCSRDRQGSR